MSGLQFLIASLILHIAIWYGLKLTTLKQTDQSQPVEITVVDSKQKQFSHSVNLKKSPDLAPERARFYAEENQIVKKETKAPNLGYLSPLPQMAKSPEEQEQEKSDDGFGKNRLNDLGPQLLSQVSTSDTTVLEHIQDGAVTSLNAERSIYYSFFSRVDKQIVARWYKNLQDYELYLSQDDAKRLGGQDLTTMVEVVLDSEGHYKKYILHQGSGDTALDMAAIKSFIMASYFPNPPKGMIKNDGTVRLFYGFTVRFPPARRWARGQ